jgi:VWFA-related protein
MGLRRCLSIANWMEWMRGGSLRVGAVLWGVVAACGWCGAQSAPAGGERQAASPSAAVGREQNGAYSLQVKSQLVILDVVVTDKKGAAVGGLTRDDFKVFENKAPQPIVSLEEVRNQGPAAVAIHSTAELDRLEPRAPVSILVLDEATSKFEDEQFARYALEKYLAREGDVLAEPTMLIAVSVQHQTLLEDYTTSKKEVLDALDRHFARGEWRTSYGNAQGHQMMATLLSLAGVAAATAGHEGHKNIVWIGRGFPSFQWQNLPLATADQFREAIATCTNRLREARATLYSVDPAGMGAALPVTHAAPDALEEGGPEEIADPFGGQVDFDTMAVATGGMALHGRNDVDRLIGDAMSYGETFYTIAYKPTATGDDAKEFRSIQVMTTDRGLTVTAPEGYFKGATPAAPALDAEGKVPTQVAYDMAVAAEGLMVYDGVPLMLERVKEKPDDFRVSFPASAVAWAADGAQEKGDITLEVSSYDKKGKLLGRDGHVIQFTRQPLREGQVEGRTLQVVATIATAAPAARVRVIVRANGSGKIGTGNYSLVGQNAGDNRH